MHISGQQLAWIQYFTCSVQITDGINSESVDRDAPAAPKATSRVPIPILLSSTRVKAPPLRATRPIPACN